MKNEFVDYEIALSLKKLGFNESCIGFYNENNIIYVLNIKNSDKREHVTSILYQQAFRFFREKYGLMHIIYPYNFTCEIDFLNDRIYDPINGDFIPHNHIVDGEGETLKHNSYEEAELTCLKELIEICRKLT